MDVEYSKNRPEILEDLPAVFYQPVRKLSCPILSVDCDSKFYPKYPLSQQPPNCRNKVPHFETYPTFSYDMQCASSMHCKYTASHIKFESLDNKSLTSNDVTKETNQRCEPPTLEDLRIYDFTDCENFPFESDQNSFPRLRGKRTGMSNKYRSFKSFQSDLNLEQSGFRLRNPLKSGGQPGYWTSFYNAGCIPNMDRGIQSFNERETAAMTCEQPAITRGRREEVNCQLKEATFSPYQLRDDCYELARKAWNGNKRSSSSTLSWSPKLLLHLLLLISSLITTSAMNIREYSSLVKRDVPKPPFEPFFTEPSNRIRRSSGSIQDILPPDSAGSATSGNMGETGSQCQVNSCNEWLHMAPFNYNRIESCVIFYNDMQCLQKIEKDCYSSMYYMGHKAWADREFKRRNCSEVLKNYTDALPTIKPGPQRNRDNLCFIEDDTGVSINSQTVFCSLFGDPHIVTYGGRKQTCTTLGAWPLVDNQFFTIQAVNVPIGEESVSIQPTSQTAEKGRPPNSQKSTESSSEYSRSNSGAGKGEGSTSETTVTSASAITRVLVVFRSRINCVEREMIYDTTEGSLPPSFNDGTFSVGPTDNLFVIQSSNGSVIELTANYIKTNIIIRRIGAYLSISVKSPVDVAKALPSYGHTNQDFHMELCSAGCPDVETLAEFPATPRPPRRSSNRVSYEIARKRCNHLEGFFLDSCIFDVMTTGDWKTFVEIGQRSSDDESRLNIRSADDVPVEQLFPAPLVEKSSSSLSVNISSSTQLVWLITVTTVLTHLAFHSKYSI